MSYQDSLHRLLSLADYERLAGLTQPRPKYELSRVRHLLARLGDPHTSAPVVHIAGTKGKGSVAAMVASILQAAGYRVGLYTSPHLHTFRERIRIGLTPVSEEQFASLVDELWPHVEAINVQGVREAVTTFELLTAMAFLHFQRQRVDAQVLEVGLGGRLDATNVASGAVCIIMPVSLDHTAVLGKTVEAIAREKAGIIKEGAQVISAPQVGEAAHVIRETCQRRGASLHLVGQDTRWQPLSHDLTGQRFQVHTPSRPYDLWTPLLGRHQVENAAVAVACAEALNGRGFSIDPQTIARGLERVSWTGRLEVLATQPLVVVDGAHNRHAMSRLAQAVGEYLPHERLLLVMGCSADKDLDGMVAEIAPLAHDVFAAPSRHPRALPAYMVSAAFSARGIPATVHQDVSAALRAALAQAKPQDLVLATGSLFVAAEAIQAVRGIPGETYPELMPYAILPHSSPG